MLEVIKKSSNKIYCKSVSRFENMTKYLLLIERDAYGNYNVYKSKDYNFNEIDLEFAMIGAISGS